MRRDRYFNRRRNADRYQLGAVLQRLGADREVPTKIPERSAALDEAVRKRRLAGS